MEVYIWLSVLILCLVAEAATMGTLIAIWFLPGAAVALLLALFHVPIWIQILAFALVSGAFLILAGTVFRRFLYRKKANTKTNLERIIGEKCKVTEEINNLAPSGAVRIGSLIWTARALSDDLTIPVGTIVVVDSIDGVKVLVRPL